MTAKPPPADIQTQITHVNGVEIVAREPGVGPHPHPQSGGRLVTWKGVSKVLLADGTEVYMCDDCGRTGPDTRSVVAHRNGTHNLRHPRRPQHSEQALRTLVRWAQEEVQERGLRGYGARVAKRLDEAGIKTTDGKPWMSEQVGRLYLVYRDKYKPARRTQKRPIPMQPVSAPPTDPAAADPVAELTALLRRGLELISQIAQTPTIDPEIVEKAKQFDQIRGLLK